jgi:taurine dioxygenase
MPEPTMTEVTRSQLISDIQQGSIQALSEFGAEIEPLTPIGAAVRGIDLEAAHPPPKRVVEALEFEMASRGFIVFRSDKPLSAEGFLRASCWWGGKALHSTHGVHPATPRG